MKPFEIKGISDSKNSILLIASELFSEFGFFGVSMSDIAKRLNLTKAALYYHFKSKEELYFQVLERSFQNLIRDFNRILKKVKGPEEKLFLLIQHYLKFGITEKNLVKSLIISPKIDPGIRKYIFKFRKKVNSRFQNFLKEILKNQPGADFKFITSRLLKIMDRLILEIIIFNRKLKIKEKTCQILKTIRPVLKGRDQKSLVNLLDLGTI